MLASCFLVVVISSEIAVASIIDLLLDRDSPDIPLYPGSSEHKPGTVAEGFIGVGASR
jgi:hypothetical protein